ncbi:hypothetical protein CWE12_05525 [Aliidiomarina sedimenti]|uniref:Uncharacterized protein n=1 Tax=Aliidiomarina sedimenti TaxID=1933879 RepID=A0ABY0C0H0_9GAMM|nr:hypothetical protein [Aliidiomarina sedimenti]RUO30704.1 hypothetical protein CWE12_05525 [Aliidiomarina sedimenti]
MNANLKAHRHPGLWSLPQAQEENQLPLFPPAPMPQVSTSQAPLTETSLPAVEQELRHLATLFQQSAVLAEQSGKWITLIGMPDDVDHASGMQKQIESLLNKAGIALHKVRWIRSTDAENKAWATEQALLLDNSALVVAWLGQCEWRDLKRLQLARKHSQAQSWLSTSACVPTPLH